MNPQVHPICINYDHIEFDNVILTVVEEDPRGVRQRSPETRLCKEN